MTASEDFNDARLDKDMGRFASGRPRDRADFYKRSFKTTTVRNAELSGPYFHNGAFTSLENVIEFYNRGGGAGLGLVVPNQTLPFDSLGLSKIESQQILTFLHALTDIESMTDRPNALPDCHQHDLSDRIMGGTY